VVFHACLRRSGYYSHEEFGAVNRRKSPWKNRARTDWNRVESPLLKKGMDGPTAEDEGNDCGNEGKCAGRYMQSQVRLFAIAGEGVDGNMPRYLTMKNVQMGNVTESPLSM